MVHEKYLLISPALALIGLLFGAALCVAIMQSLGFAPWFGINEFPTIQYYRDLWATPSFWQSLGLTLYYAIMATCLSTIFGLALAIILNKAFKFDRLTRNALRLPLMIPYTVGIALALIMMGDGGIFSRIAAQLGMIETPRDFPALIHSHYGWGIITVYVWKQTPFMTLAISSVLAGLGTDMRDAAYTLGATPKQVFFRVTLPQILRGISAAALISFAFNLGAFEAPFILGGGFPETLPVMAWRFFNDADYALQLRGMAVIISLIFLAIAVLLIFNGLKSLSAYRDDTL